MAEIVPKSAGWYEVTLELPGAPEWADGFRAAFAKWTLDMVNEGPSEAVTLLPSFEFVPETADDPPLVRLRWVEHTARSSWLAIKDVMEETAGVIFRDLLDSEISMRITVDATRTVGRNVEVGSDNPVDL